MLVSRSCGLAALFFPCLVFALSPEQWLDKMSRSLHEMNYLGVYSYEQGDHMESLRLVHAVIDGKEYERLEHLDGLPREVVRSGHGLSCVHAGDRLLRIPDAASEDNVQRFKSQYAFDVIADKERIAGRDTVRIAMQAKDRFRHSYQLNLDEQTALPLRFVVLSEDNSVLERFQFADITIGTEPPSELLVSQRASFHPKHFPPVMQPESQGQKAEADNSWRLEWIPEGFLATSSMDKNSEKYIYTFTDGLAAFSVFIEPSPSDSEKVNKVMKRGATVLYSHNVAVAFRNYQVTVAGEIPELAARRIAQSVVGNF